MSNWLRPPYRQWLGLSRFVPQGNIKGIPGHAIGCINDVNDPARETEKATTDGGQSELLHIDVAIHTLRERATPSTAPPPQGS